VPEEVGIMKLNYTAKCSKCGNTREVLGFKRKIRKFNLTKPSLAYVKCPGCGRRTRHEVLK
jgi:endogenous inhibitor of DNA gyrase (YacG/DUF329 family)